MDALGADPGAVSAVPWWRSAVFYRVDLRSFADSNRDGVGDLDGVRQRLGYVELLGVDALWLTTLLAAPITDYSRSRVDPVLGELESFEQLVEEAHASGLRVAVDVAAEPGRVGDPEFAEAVRFWLDRGVDGLRVGSAPGSSDPAGAAVREILRELRPVVADYPGRGIGALVDESWFDRYDDEPDWDIGVDLRFSRAEFDAQVLQDVITQILSSTSALGVRPVWVATSSDQMHPVTRFGGGSAGRAKARAIALVTLALPGIVGLDNGEELGLPHGGTAGWEAGAPVRGPMPWEGDEPPFGFSTAPGSWWPVTQEWGKYTVEAQLEDPDSSLSLYRRALELRREHPALQGDRVAWFGAPSGCLAFRKDPGNLTCALNTSSVPVPLPPGEVLLSSGALDGDRLPANTAIWLV